MIRFRLGCGASATAQAGDVIEITELQPPAHPVPLQGMTQEYEMSAVHKAIEDYVLGNGPQEQERLKLQAGFLDKWTEQFFRLAGIAPGMRVLDLGCGMGDVSLLAAKLVGPSGRVTGIDRDLVVIEKARMRRLDEKYSATIDYVHAETLKFHADETFDAVVGRYVLFSQPDPAGAIRHAAKQVHPNGIIVFHETDFANQVRSSPDGALFERMYPDTAAPSSFGNERVDLGSYLTRLFIDAGLPWPAIKAVESPAFLPITNCSLRLFGLFRRVLNSLDSPAPTNYNSIRSLRERLLSMEVEAITRHTQLIGPLQFGAWTRKPGN